MFRAIAVFITLFLLTISADARPKPSALATAPLSQRMQPAGTLLDYKRINLGPFYRAKGWRILYVTRDYQKRPILSTGMVVLPDYAPKVPMERKFIAWGHPTTGVARKCAPSLRQKPTESILGLNALVTAGLVVAATDYPGLGTEGPVGYLVGKGQAYAMIDSVRAARQIPGVGGSKTYGLWGYSQGGHAVLFAAEEAASYAPELALVGAAAVAPPTDLAKLLRANIGTLEGRVLASMTIASWVRKYGVSPDMLIDAQVRRVVEDVNSNCVDDVGGQLDILAAQKPLQKKFLNFDPGSRKPWSRLLWENSIFSLNTRVPLYIAQGSSDSLVRPEVTLNFARTSCQQGVVVRYVALPGKGHTTSAQAAAPGAIAWLVSRLKGQPAPNNCR